MQLMTQNRNIMIRVTILLLSLIGIISITKITAQSLAYPKFKGNHDFSVHLYNTLSQKIFNNEDTATSIIPLNTVCTKSTGTIQLFFSKENKINNVKITGKCPTELKEELINITKASESLWELPKDCYRGVPIVIPYFIHISNGCKKLYSDPNYLRGRGFIYGIFLHNNPYNNIPLKCFLLDPLYFVSDDGVHDIDHQN
jgi:hypothetical protein